MKRINKKSQLNDISIISGILIFFVLLGTVLPFIASAFNSQQNENNINSNNVKKHLSESSISIWRVLFSIVTVFFWSFEVNIWINIIILEPMRILAYFIIARNIWIGGGA